MTEAMDHCQTSVSRSSENVSCDSGLLLQDSCSLRDLPKKDEVEPITDGTRSAGLSTDDSSLTDECLCSKCLPNTNGLTAISYCSTCDLCLCEEHKVVSYNYKLKKLIWNHCKVPKKTEQHFLS